MKINYARFMPILFVLLALAIAGGSEMTAVIK